MISHFEAKLVLDDLCQEVERRANYLRGFAGEMDQIDAAIEDKKRELEGLHPQVAAAQQTLERLYKEIAKLTGKLNEERQARDCVA
jgi:septal ring factor EnvC (AmiA/AmiB activator)